MRRVTGVVVAVAAAWLVASAFLFVWPREDEAGRADAVVVLAGAHSRLDKGIQLVREDVAPLLVISDGNQPGWLRANRLCDGETDLRVRCFDPEPYSTHGEAETLRRLVAQNEWRRIVVVTSGYHVTRSRMLMRRCLEIPVATVASPTSPATLALNIPWETAKLLWQVTLEREC